MVLSGPHLRFINVNLSEIFNLRKSIHTCESRETLELFFVKISVESKMDGKTNLGKWTTSSSSRFEAPSSMFLVSIDQVAIFSIKLQVPNLRFQVPEDKFQVLCSSGTGKNRSVALGFCLDLERNMELREPLCDQNYPSSPLPQMRRVLTTSSFRLSEQLPKLIDVDPYYIQ